MHPPVSSANEPALWLVPALAGWVLGTALQLQQPALWTLAWYGALAGVALAALLALMLARAAVRRSRPRWWAGRLAVLAAAAALAFAACGARSAVFAEAALDPALEGLDIEVVGVVAAMPQRNDGGLRFRLQVDSASRAGTPVVLPPRLELHWYRGSINFETAAAEPVDELQRAPPDLRAGQRWRMTVRLKAPHGGRNPHGFDYELWLWEQGLQATGYVRAGPHDPPPRWLADGWGYPVERARQAVRDAIYARMAPPAAADTGTAAARERQRQAGVVAALVVGDQNAIDRADWDVFRATGVAHLMSISGLHVTMFAWLAGALVGWLWRRSDVLGWRAGLLWPAPQVALVGGLALAAAYAVFSGWGVPSQRTVWMLATVGLLRGSGRRWPWPLVWLLACAVVVAVDPWALLQAGFWLSFVAVGVLYASDTGTAAPPLAGGWRGLYGRARAMLREQLVVTLALTPLTLLLFQQVSLVGLVANFVAIPWVTLVVTPLALLGLVAAPIWDVAGGAVTVLAWWLRWLAALPGATVSVAAAPVLASAAGVLGGVLLVMRLPWGVRALGVPLLLPVLLWQAPRPAPGEFSLLVADIGQGNAVLVRTASHGLVFDTGPRFGPDSDAGHLVLVPLLRALGERIDTVVVSHRDSDHSGGAEAVLAMQPQARFLTSIEASHPLHLVRPIEHCQAGQHWRWDGVDFAILHPEAADYASPQKPNAMSCVLRIASGAHAALLVGDIEKAQEARLVASRPEELVADVLLVPHHGSKTSSTPAFLDAVSPRFALVQAGYRNRFGHPAAPVVARYDERQITLVDSSHCGAMAWSSADASALACERDLQQKYWQHRLVPRPNPALVAKKAAAAGDRGEDSPRGGIR